MCMTDLQIQFYKASEEKRHNLASEALTSWFNQATAATNQMNAETNRLNYGVNAANAETNRANMLINRQNADTNAANAQTNYYNMLVNRTNAETNRMNADTNAYNAQTNRLNYTVNKQNADTNRLNYMVNKQNADTNARNAAINFYNAETQRKRYDLDVVNSSYQQKLWDAETYYKQQITDPTVEKLRSETLRNLANGGKGGSGGSKSFISNLLASNWLMNDLGKLNQMGNGTLSWLDTNKSSQWFGSMLSSPFYTAASFGRLAGKAVGKVFHDQLNKQEVYKNTTGAVDYPKFWYDQMNEKYGIWH